MQYAIVIITFTDHDITITFTFHFNQTHEARVVLRVATGLSESDDMFPLSKTDLTLTQRADELNKTYTNLT